MSRNPSPLRDHIDIAAPVATVWGMVSDVCRMPDWSPQVDSTRLRPGCDRIALGARFTNRNSHGELRWTTHAEVVRFVPEREVAFRIEENWVTWSFLVESLPGGRTRLIQSRETPEGISPLSLDLTERYMGGIEAFTADMRAGMRETLERIKATAELDARQIEPGRGSWSR